jgi:hypothetical protein
LKEIEVGNQYGRLTVIALNNKHWRGNSWVCKCECGKEVVLCTIHLLGSKTRRPNKSCGCSENVHDGNTIKHKRIYNIWYGIIKRCYHKHSGSYERYGGKGIRMEDVWKDSFDNFLEWSLANGYTKELTIDRIDSKKDYGPDNCRWVDYYTQAQNKSILKSNKTGVTGVYKSKYGYKVDISRNGIKLGLGHYKDFEKAKSVRYAAEKYFKENGTLEGFSFERGI